jgi:hypothetical protein
MILFNGQNRTTKQTKGRKADYQPPPSASQDTAFRQNVNLIDIAAARGEPVWPVTCPNDVFVFTPVE